MQVIKGNNHYEHQIKRITLQEGKMIANEILMFDNSSRLESASFAVYGENLFYKAKDSNRFTVEKACKLG